MGSRDNFPPVFIVSGLYLVTMEFSNDRIDISDLPRAEQVEWQPLESTYAKSVAFRAVVSWFLFCGAFLIVRYFVPGLQQKWMLIWGISGITVLHFFSWLISYLSFLRKAYALRERDILFRSGWIVRVEEVCPFSRVQHCSVSSGLIDRNLGLATLRVYTAGSGRDISIPGLREETALSIKAYLTQKIGAEDEEQAN